MTNAEQVKRSSIPTYPYVSVPIPDSIALGIQSLITYNGLILNDRLRPDRYRVTEVDGLGGADVRDSRASQPQADGEIIYDAYRGGKTITIEGKMEAGSTAELGRMERDLRAAYGSPIESPMKFNWWDVRDTFFDALTSNVMWKSVIGSYVPVTGNGILSFSSSESLIYYSKRSYCDYQFIGKVSAISSGTTSTIGVAGAISNTSYITADLVVSSGKLILKLNAVTSVGTTLLGEVALGVVPWAQPSYWIELSVVGDEVIAAVYSEDPIEGIEIGSKLGEITAMLGGVISEQFGYEQFVYAGIHSTGSGWVSQDFRAQGIYPGDFVYNVRSISDPVVKNTMQTTSGKYFREFQLTIRASKPYGICPVQLRYEFGENFLKKSVINKGTGNALMVVVINASPSHPAGEPSLLNQTTGQEFKLNETFEEPITINTLTKEVTNSFGENILNTFSPQSSWPILQPGINLLQGGEALFSIFWNHTYR
jgi:Phage tail protein